jgi:glutamate racemase
VIGVFDSGIGGLGVLRYILQDLPNADIIYIADQGNAPYGPRPLSELADIAADISRRLIAQGASTIVIACNTASSAALHSLRQTFPGTRFVGMEPALKPASVGTKSGVIGVLATEATFQSELFESAVHRFAGNSEVTTAACPDWVELVESGVVEGPEAEAAVRARVTPLLEEGADTLVLACTHFPVLAPLITAVVGPDVAVVDPAPAVARQVARVYDVQGTGNVRVSTTGSDEQRAALDQWLQRLNLPGPSTPFPA